MKYFATICLLASAMNCMALNVAQLFMAEPGIIFTSLSDGARAEMVTNYNSNDTSTVLTYMGTEAKINMLDTAANYLDVSTSKSQRVEIKLLISGNLRDTVIAVIHTLSTPAPDSRIAFYNTHWKQLSTKKYFKMPTLDDFKRNGITKQQWNETTQNIAFPLIKLSFEGENRNILNATLTLNQFYPTNEWRKIEPALINLKRYAVEGTKIKPLQH